MRKVFFIILAFVLATLFRNLLLSVFNIDIDWLSTLIFLSAGFLVGRMKD